jgi:short-subunit dehydrogenase
MQILILGASSAIGTALARSFAHGNGLLLVGRNELRLQSASSACLSAGAASVTWVSHDFRSGIRQLLEALGGRKVDLIIDAASAASGGRDASIEAGGLADMVRVDFLCRTELFEAILRGQPEAPAVIYISTVLALVRSPNRMVYSSLKQLNGIYLQKLQASNPHMRVLIVYVGKVIATKLATAEPAALAAAVREAFEARRATLLYGWSGHLFLGLFYAQPLVFFGVTRMQRWLRGLVNGARPLVD